MSAKPRGSRNSDLALLAFAVLSLALSCSGRQPAPPNQNLVTVQGVVTNIDDASDLDGPIQLNVTTEDGRTYHLFFESMWTKPAPTPARKALFKVIHGTRVGDHVQVRGSRMKSGQVRVERIVNADRE